MLTLMLYASAVSGVIGLGVWLVERFLSGRRLSTRWLWLAALGAMVVVTVLPASQRTTGPTSQAPATSVSAPGPVSQSKPFVILSEAKDLLSPAAPRTLTTDVLLLGTWVTLSLIGLLVLAGSAYRIARMQRVWRPAEIAGVPVMLSHDVGPAIVGLIHHGVVMPAWVETLPPVQQKLIVTHEREHLRAGDPLLLWSATLLVVLFPWNPAMWLALRALRHAIEIDCDARVLASQPDTREYCSLLLDVGERTLAGVAPMAALAEPSTLLERRVHVMTARLGTSAKTIAALGAGVLLLAAACVAPRTQLAPRRDALSLMQELSGLLRSDSVMATIPPDARVRLASQLAPEHDAVVNDGSTGGTFSDWMGRLDPSLDRALAEFYPVLGDRADTKEKLVVLTYDDSARLVGHELFDLERARKAEPAIEGIEVVEKRFISKHTAKGMYQVLIHQERPRLHAEVLIRVKRGPVRTMNVRPRPVYPDAGAALPPVLQFGRRADSLALVDFPEANRPNDDAYVVAVQFSEKGEIVRRDARHLPVAQVFDTIPDGRNLGTRNSGYLMDLMQGLKRPWSKSGSTVNSNLPHTVVVWGVVAEW